MHILHITPYYAPAYSFGGVVRMVEGLARAQVAQGHRVTVLTTDALSREAPSSEDADTVRDGVRVVRCRNWVYPLRRYNLDTTFGIAKQARQIMPDVDVVHLHEFRTMGNLLAVPVAAAHRVPIVLSPHGTLTYTTGRSALKSVWDRWLSPRIAPYIEHVLALSAAEADDVRQTWRQFQQGVTVSIVPNGVDPAPYHSLPDAATFRERYQLDDAQVVLFMGRLHQRKGVDVLARGFQRAALPNTKLLLVGPDEGMQATIEALGDDTIILTGFLSGDARLQALAVADIFVLPAIGEGLSMAALEAMAAGLPVLLSEGCHLPQAAAANAGRIIPIEADAIADALQVLLADRDQLAMMSDNARALIASQFTWERIASQISDIYKNLSTP